MPRGLGLAVGLLAAAAGCHEAPPRSTDDLCALFEEKPNWYRSARQSRLDWGVPESLQLAIMKHESAFQATARPPRRRFLWIFPGRRRSSAYGYAQAIDATWSAFQAKTGRPSAARHDFDDAAHFIGWYGHQIHRRTGVAKDDAFRLYLAYHEGPAAFLRSSYRQKAWLRDKAAEVAAEARRFESQYRVCAARLARREKWRHWPIAVGLLTVALAVSCWALRRARPRG